MYNIEAFSCEIYDDVSLKYTVVYKEDVQSNTHA